MTFSKPNENTQAQEEEEEEVASPKTKKEYKRLVS